MIPNPIVKVLSIFRTSQVRALLMGGQACVCYGAAEFSRDTDFAVLAEPANLARLRAALGELQAECIAVPPLTEAHLRRGHAIHFRCGHPEAKDLRVDAMAVMRGVASFEELWQHRTTLVVEPEFEFDLLSLPDLVRAKKTQRDKDWPMIARLVEANYATFGHEPSDERLAFWLAEGRTPELLLELAGKFPAAAQAAVASRPLLAHALRSEAALLIAALRSEQQEEMEQDRQYWLPLRRELEAMRHAALRAKVDRPPSSS